ncbi:MAG: UbiA family prenyltransferase [Bacteroidales bacterium]|nr:UbiA family prenyltransferase [Bacteroidales bacterium]
MKEFFNLLGWKDLIVVFLALILIRISIIIPFYNQWYLPPSISWENFLMFAFGICFLFAGNNIAVKFYDEKTKVLSQTSTTTLNIKDYPDIARLRGLWVVLWFVGIIAVCYSCIKIGSQYYYIALAVITLLIGYAYASYLRHSFLLGNLSLAVLYSAVILSQLPHDSAVLVPYSYKFPNPAAITYNDLSVLFICLAALVFFLTLLRDMTGDVTNTEDDKKMNYPTLGVKLGINRSKTVLYAISIIFILLNGVFLYFYAEKIGVTQVILTIILSVVPVIYCMVLLRKAKLQTDFNYLYVCLGVIYISLLFVISFCKYLFIHGNL